MNEIVEPLTPEITTAPPPVQLNPQDQRREQVNSFLQSTGSVLRIILAGIGRVVGEIAGLIFRR